MNTPGQLPVIFLIHPVGIGATRAMNVLSAKLWLRALVDLLPDVAIAAPWLPYAEAMIDHARGLRDASIFARCCEGTVAVGGQFNQGTRAEWELFRKLGHPRIDLTRPPLPALLTYETFAETQLTTFRRTVIDAFSTIVVRKAA
jgi:hypothetical protein